jgi:hypothetical protein
MEFQPSTSYIDVRVSSGRPSLLIFLTKPICPSSTCRSTPAASTLGTDTTLSNPESPAQLEGDTDVESVAVISRSRSHSESSVLAHDPGGSDSESPYVLHFRKLSDEARKRSGKCAFFIAKKGYGFIKCDRQSELDWEGRDEARASLDGGRSVGFVDTGRTTYQAHLFPSFRTLRLD